MAVPFSYNVRSVLGRPWSALATALGIGLVVAILVLALALAAGFQASLVETGSPDNVIVMRKGADSELSSGVVRDAAAIIASGPEVARGPGEKPLASPEVVVLINQDRKGGKGSSNVTIRGVDPDGLALRSGLKIVEGRNFTPGTAEVIVARRMAARFEGFGLGQSVRLGQHGFAIVGHFDAGGSAFDSEIWGDNAVLMPALQRGDAAFQSVTFRMRDPSRFAAIKKELEADPRLRVQARQESEYYAAQSEGLATTIRIAGIMIVIIMAVGAIFAAMNTMFASVGARTREIATLLTLGFGPGSVMLSFVAESVLIALAGGVIGCLLALPINGTATSTTNFSTFSEVAFAFRITPPALVTGLVFSFVLGVVGGLLPAWRAARLPLAAAMRAL
ncbi:MAG: ABC transporter permease [Candidatus Eiseniibacteriota bacterium]